MADPRLTKRAWRGHANFPTYTRSRVITDVRFAENPELHENAFCVGPVEVRETTENVVNYTKQKKRKRNRKKLFTPEETPNKEAEGAANNPQNQEPQHSEVIDTAKNPPQPNPTEASQPANVQSTQQRQTEMQNRDVKKRKADGEAANVDVPTQPHKKLTTEEANNHAEEPVVSRSRWRDDTSTMFSCTLCQYLTSEEKQIERHFNCVQHREVLKHLKYFFPKQRVDFLHDYFLWKSKKNSRKVMFYNRLPYRDHLKGIGHEHYIHRVNAAHCQACDVLIPDNPESVAMHIKSPDHRWKRQKTFRNIKENSLWAAKMLFRDANILHMLTKYDAGQNPFEAGSSSTSTCETQVAEKEDHTNDEDVVAVASDDEEFPDNHNEEKDSGNKRFLLDEPEMKEPADMTKETSSKTAEEESEEAAEAP